MPDGQVAPENLPTANRGDWRFAPQIVHLAYWLLFLGIILSPLIVLMSLARPTAETPLRIIFGSIAFCVSIWMRNAIRNGEPIAWAVQIILSFLGLFGFPLGTIIHCYVLLNWFKPETKAWFQKQ
jgi:hypothetical protein